jgi:hypothetical protein
MLYRPAIAAVAASALIAVGSTATAQQECGGIWAARCAAKAGAHPAKKKADAKAVDEAPAASEGAAGASANASAAGAANADQNAIVMAGSLGAVALPGLATGLTVKTSGGTTVGTVSKVVKGSDGSVSQIIVTSPSGKSFPLAANKLSMSGGVVIAADSTDQ